MRKLIPYGKQYIDKEDKLSVLKVLSRDIITTGDEVIKFENKIKNFLKSKYATVCNSGTSAIFLALASLNLKRKDIIIMPVINFISSYNIAKLFNVKVFLADVDKQTGQMRPDDVLNCCKKFKIKKVKAIIVMYNGGNPINSDQFYKLKKKFGCIIIEDACHALGAEYIFKKKKYKIGSCKHADICTFSLHPLKTITTGEGGVVTTNSKKFHEQFQSLRSHGIKKFKNHWQYDVSMRGLNLRLNDFQCALGISQLKKINLFLKARNKISNKYRKELSKVPGIYIQKLSSKYKSSNHLFIVNLKKPNLFKKEKLFKFMLKYKIMLQYHYIPIYKFKICTDKYISNNAKKYYNSAMSLPIFYKLTSREQNYIIKKIKEFFIHPIKKIR